MSMSETFSEKARDSQMKVVLDIRLPKIFRFKASENMAKIDGNNGMSILVEAPIP